MIVNNLSYQVNGKNIIDDVSFVLSNKNKVGLVGVNGSGKTTLLKILSSKLKDYTGNVNNESETIAYLKQEIEPKYNDLSIFEYVKQETGLKNLEEKLKILENNLTEENMEEYGELLNNYLLLDGYSVENNLKEILNGLNFKKDLYTKISTLSGGEKIKILLSVVLLKNADILLLDEPTNNLDLEAILWLEQKLKNSNKKMLIISHDETFLNNIVNKIFELSKGNLTEYNLSYEEYLKEKHFEYEQEKLKYESLQEKRKNLKKQLQKAKEWVNGINNKKAHNDNDKLANNYQKEKTNMGNISKLSKELENIEIPTFEEKKPISVFFNFDDIKGNKDISIENLVCGYDDFRTSKINIYIPFGSKVSIKGENGSGKTTFLKTILGFEEPLSGNLKIGNAVKLGYISQNTLENVEDEETIITYLLKNNSKKDKSQIFSILDKFDINYEDRNKVYVNLSPGERTRVNLARLAVDDINTLVMDEVTNHLDKKALDLIYELIEKYEGTIISVSHNRRYNELLDSDITLDIKTGEVKQKVKKIK